MIWAIFGAMAFVAYVSGLALVLWLCGGAPNPPFDLPSFWIRFLSESSLKSGEGGRG